MRVLVDEQMPIQVLEPLRLNKGHEFDHVHDLGWKGKHDEQLFHDGARRGYDAILTLDVNQLSEAKEARALKKAGLHHISLRQGRNAQGIGATARVIASVVVAMPYVIADLEKATGQRIVVLSLLSSGARHEMFDPAVEPHLFPYWK